MHVIYALKQRMEDFIFFAPLVHFHASQIGFTPVVKRINVLDIREVYKYSRPSLQKADGILFLIQAITLFSHAIAQPIEMLHNMSSLALMKCLNQIFKYNCIDVRVIRGTIECQVQGKFCRLLITSSSNRAWRSLITVTKQSCGI